MLGSAVHPCFTITFAGGQFVGGLDVEGDVAFPAAGGSVAPRLAEAEEVV
jgi:hypothetical protein